MLWNFLDPSKLFQPLARWLVKRRIQTLDNLARGLKGLDMSVFTSVTFWVNVLSGAAALLAQTNGYLPEPYAGYAAGAVAIINIILHNFLKRPV